MANSLISYNRDRQERTLANRQKNGVGVIQILQYKSLNNEVCGIANIIQDCISEGYRPEDILVLAQRRRLIPLSQVARYVV